jgi:DNA-binding NarL/FixJ family response regulator
MQPITVAIEHQDRAVRAACERLLRNEPGIIVVETTHEDFVAAVATRKIRIVLSSLALMCADEGCPLLVTLRRECPATRVVLLADHSDQEERLVRAIARGARGYLEHDAVERYLADAMHGVDRGESWVPRKILGKIMERGLR